MKKALYLSIFLFFSLNSLFAQTNRYDIKSGIVEYDIVGAMDNSTMTGTSVLYFKDFGKIELLDERITYKRGNFEDEEERNINKISKDKLYTVDFNDEMIYSQDLQIDKDDPVGNIKNKESFTQMGAKFLGNENILGYKCDIWQLGEYKIWIYNSVPLKQITKSSGNEQMQIAKNANFNIDIKDNKFKLPNFPVKAIDIIISEGED
ncbi:hypothetical protein [Aliarcobacter vitoriensis]|uniref:DUF4412 domain-containing protein n=1 Tax=Aliarcobacter vitoriensis TaxID=2011099 RepID=A0A366MPD8_9BACT|nr:hypothetical protein [Aliarcobacter vitoriensis]RBQ28126.1 hypothetical protein CRU91_10960 [Aliarcobacter vitoriensis]